MPYEDSIQHLFYLFLQYKQARSQREKAKLDAEILQLFDTLGASITPAMVSVRDEFERMRTVPAPQSPKRRLKSEAKIFVRDRLQTIELEPNAPALTQGAKEMLRIPITELFENEAYRNGEEVDKSLSRIVGSLREEPHSRSEGYGPLRTSIAVIRAYAKNFCNIPPFCSGKEYE
jgi:hypothetical protein